MKTTRLITQWAAGLMVLCFAGNAAAFGSWDTYPIYKAISADHTNYGVSQMLVGSTGDTFSSHKFAIANPGKVRMRAVMLFYTRAVQEDVEFDGDYRDDFSNTVTPSRNLPQNNNPEEYLGCATFNLTPHAFVGVEENTIDDAIEPFCPRGIGSDCRVSFEIIAAPVEGVQFGNDAQTYYIADGLGLAPWAPAGNEARGDGPDLVHPRLFSLPHNTTANPQAKNSALNGICAVAVEEGNRRMWEGFGIGCWGGPLGLAPGAGLPIAQEFCTPP